MEESFAIKSDVTALKNEMGAMFVNLKTWLMQYLDQRFNFVNDRLEVVDGRLVTIDDRLEVVDGRLVTIDDRFDDLELMVKKGFDAVDERFNQVDHRLETLEEHDQRRFHQTQLLAKRITVLESKQPA